MLSELLLVQPEKAIAAVLFLMTVYRRTQCPVVARAIATHLNCLARHREVSDSVRSVCEGLKNEWECVAMAHTACATVH
jgi:predicted transcriptional regulator